MSKAYDSIVPLGEDLTLPLQPSVIIYLI